MSVNASDAWNLLPLNELGEVNRGRSRHRPRYAEHLYGGPYPFVQTGDVKASEGRISTFNQTYSEAGLRQSRLWPKGTMCITIAATIAETGILDFPACFPDSVVGFIADPAKADVRFVEYAFRLLKSNIQHEASGSVQDNINLQTLSRLNIPIPSLAEQQAIAEVLAALDDKVAANTNLAHSLAELASAQFSRIYRRCTGPRPLAELVSTQYGVTTSAHNEAGPRFLRVTDINKKPWVEWATTPHCTVSDTDLSKYSVAPGDILVARMADPGKAALIDEGDPEAVFASYLVRLRAYDSILAMFIYYFLRSPDYAHYATGAAQGSVQKNMNARVIVGTEMLMPSPQDLTEFNEVVRPLRQHIQNALNQNLRLAAARDALLPHIMSGKLRVKDAAKLVETSI